MNGDRTPIRSSGVYTHVVRNRCPNANPYNTTSCCALRSVIPRINLYFLSIGVSRPYGVHISLVATHIAGIWTLRVES